MISVEYCRFLKNRLKIFFAALIIIFSLVLLFSGNNVHAADNSLVVDHISDSEVKPGKSFTTKLIISDEQGIGGILIEIDYPSSEISLKSITVDNKNANEFLRYYDNDGCVKLIYAVRNSIVRQRVINIKWAQSSDDSSGYEFICNVMDAVDRSNISLVLPEKNILFLEPAVSHISEEARPSETGQTGRSESSSSRTSSKAGSKTGSTSSGKTRSSKSSKSSKASGSYSKNVSDGKSSAASKSESSMIVKKFDYEKYKDNLSDDDFSSKAIGIIVIIVVVILVAWKFVRRINKRFPE